MAIHCTAASALRKNLDPDLAGIHSEIFRLLEYDVSMLPPGSRVDALTVLTNLQHTQALRVLARAKKEG